MGEVVNLRQARKRSARERKAAEADANRAAFGLSTKLKAKARGDRARAEAALDGRRLDRGPAAKNGAPD